MVEPDFQAIAKKAKDEIIQRIFLKTIDPKASIPNCPAMTTLLYKVCNNDQSKFEEACRLIELFIFQGIEEFE